MDYPVKTLSQLRPILQGFRKAADLTQAMVAEKLGVTQQTYAQFEASPETMSIERLFRVLRVMNASLVLTQSGETQDALPLAKETKVSSLVASTAHKDRVTKPSEPVKESMKKKPPKRAAGTQRSVIKKREDW